MSLKSPTPNTTNLYQAAASGDLWAPLHRLLQRYGMSLERVQDGAPIPGSYWGECEAGLIASRLLARLDTPVHSTLHEACHFICMDQARREQLHTDAGGDDLEECGVCYLQILLADHLPGLNRDTLMDDMDDWGYSFRLGDTRNWFHHDADDAREWLITNGLIDMDENVLFVVRK